ncbi:bucentaur or craniofacial development domain-containing protein [Besnoitia besnoiti]|uniref:Bucentaur or craniofacial development domain-containing protein n=1 Tax=Besnoitia besnoiti TaxID=94643 RepID=A0A2A9MLM8_BESBE|nr:bucentaur or craniofacial development domain-containing protein [Besnoitia besnoiti]PFH36613.1 bucentaur or craniofacial development domain-containing protein [Besnoitia besnoiti]
MASSLLDMKFGSDTEDDDEDYAGSAGPSEGSAEEGDESDDAAEEAPGQSGRPSAHAYALSGASAGLLHCGTLQDTDDGELTAGRRAPVVSSSARRKRLLRDKKNQEAKKRSKATKKAEEEARKEEVCSLFAEMEEESRQALVAYNSPTRTDDFLLQFHRRCPPTGEKKNGTWGQLQHHLSIAVSALQSCQSASAHLAVDSAKEASPEPSARQSAAAAAPGDAKAAPSHEEKDAEEGLAAGSDTRDDDAQSRSQASSEPLPSGRAFSVREFKQRCRRPTDAAMAKMREEAMRNLDSTGEITVKKIVQFAGKSVEIEVRMEAASEQYQKFLQKQQKTQQLGGQFAELDGLVSALDGPSAINSVQKSQADWEKFKRDRGIEAELKKGHGYLDKQAFLAATEWRQHEQNVEVRRRLQLQQQMSQSNSSRS